MWCTSSDTPSPVQGIPEPHHRIVRIPPGESVVLNSAERAPYLLLIEIIHGDLDFDPSKRGNKEVLRKFIAKEDGRSGPSYTINGDPQHATAMTRQESISIPGDKTELAFGTDDPDTKESESSPGPPQYPPTPPSDDEEMDLIEQLYGTDESLRSRPLDLSETVVLPPPPKNRELDMATWSRSVSNPPSPTMPEEPATAPPISHLRQAQNMHRSTSSKSSIKPIKTLSLDEYSERMRTAAVMLAQLNANLVREPSTMLVPPGTPVPVPETPSPLRWLPGGSWLAGSGTIPPSNDDNRQVYDSLTVSTPGPSSNVPMRMKLQHAEAAAIRRRIMEEMLALEEERMERMRENRDGEGILRVGDMGGKMKTAEDEGIIRRELSKVDPSAVVFSESWSAKKVSDIFKSWFFMIAEGYLRVEYGKRHRTVT